jgi:hypothetical protein
MRARVLAGMAVAVAVLGNVVTGGVAATAAGCAPPEVSIAEPRSMYEGSDGGMNSFSVTMTMAQPAAGCPQTGSVSYQTVDGTATAGPDYVTTTGTVTWTAPGAKKVSLDVVRDDQGEQDEYFTVTLSGPRGVTIVDASAKVEVLNDDAGPSIGDLVVALPDSGICWWPNDHCAIPVQLNTIARAPVSVRVRTVDGTAVADKDYLPVKDRVVTIPAGADRVDVPVGLLAGAAPGEYFGVEIVATNAGTVGLARTRVTIRER